MNLLAKMVKPCLNFEWVTPAKVKDIDPDITTLLPPTSHIGGNPLLPPNFVWPTSPATNEKGETYDRALVFCAQINLADIKNFKCAESLPDHGILSFFSCGQYFDFDDPFANKVVYFEDVDSLVETENPDACKAKDEEQYEFATIPLYYLAVSSERSYISWIEAQDYENELKTADGTVLTKEQMDDLIENYDDYAAELESLNRNVFDDHTQLLGYGVYIQNPCVTSDDKQLLFTLSSYFDEENNKYSLCIGDAGSIYFFIKTEDLKNLNFENTECEMQCY